MIGKILKWIDVVIISSLFDLIQFNSEKKIEKKYVIKLTASIWWMTLNCQRLACTFQSNVNRSTNVALLFGLKKFCKESFTGLCGNLRWNIEMTMNRWRLLCGHCIFPSSSEWKMLWNFKFREFLQNLPQNKTNYNFEVRPRLVISSARLT